MSSMNVTLEPSEGPSIRNPSREQIRMTLDRIGNGLDHCILELGTQDEYLQAAGSAGRLLVQYRDTRGMFESVRSDLDVALVECVFADAMAGATGWKTQIQFRAMDTPRDAPPASRGPGEDLLDAAKKAAKAGVQKLMKGGLRGLFGGRS